MYKERNKVERFFCKLKKYSKIRDRSEKTTNWLWIAPGLVFLLGIVVGVWLAPMGLSYAFESLKLSFVAIMHYFPESTLPWALALVLAIIVLTMDNMRGWFRR